MSNYEQRIRSGRKSREPGANNFSKVGVEDGACLLRSRLLSFNKSIRYWSLGMGAYTRPESGLAGLRQSKWWWSMSFVVTLFHAMLLFLMICVQFARGVDTAAKAELVESNYIRLCELSFYELGEIKVKGG